MIRKDDEFQSNTFNDWFKETDIQWKQSASHILDQNVIIEWVMYTIMTFVRSVLKTTKLSKNMWNVIKDAVIYIKNRIIISSGNDKGAIISFESVNDVFSDISNLRALGCRVYTHVLKTFNRHKLNDRCWKDIHVDYDKNN